MITARRRQYLWLLLLSLGLWVAGCAYVTIRVVSELPSLEQLENPPQELASRVLSADGEVIGQFFVKQRAYLPFDSIPPAFLQGLIATEDRAFYRHWGIHMARIVKAFIKNLLTGDLTREGASTLTQQLARNLYFGHEVSLWRKLREAITAIQLEHTYSKQEILEMYTNTVYFGRGAYGLTVASQVYFDKSPSELSLSEIAYLVAVLKAPELYDAHEYPERALQRRNLVLRLMWENGFISESQARQAMSEPLRVVATPSHRTQHGIAPHFLELLRQTISQDVRLQGYDLYRDGLTIYTTLNARIQRYALAAVREHLAEYQRLFDRLWKWPPGLLAKLVDQAIRRDPRYLSARPEERDAVARRLRSDRRLIDSVRYAATRIQVGVVVLDIATGDILALVGAAPEVPAAPYVARSFLNHVIQIRRQPGSAFKPFVYAAALQRGLSPNFQIPSGPFRLVLADGTVWAPQGSGEHLGPTVTLHTALKYSINTVAARLITEYTTPSEVAALARRLGIETPLRPVPALALGASEVTPLELTNAYATIARQGIRIQPRFLLRVEDRYGNVLLDETTHRSVSDALPAAIARQLIAMLTEVVNGGTGSSIRRWYTGAAAGKTGTTNDFADAWFVGFTPDVAAGVWVGFDDRRITFTGWYGQGGRAAAPIWGRLMQKLYADTSLPYRPRNFELPNVTPTPYDTLTPDLLLNPPPDLPPLQ
ncbi:MAG: PBP1A family penicillin-binding protein [Chlorobiota bacterium]